MKYIFCVWISFSFTCAAYCQSSKREQIILGKVAALPEVKSFMKNSRASKPEIIMAGTPDKNLKYYWVKVGLSNLDMFRTKYDFYVDPKTFEIYYLDMMVEEGPTHIALKLWRRYNNTKEFNNQMHTYKAGRLIVLRD